MLRYAGGSKEKIIFIASYMVGFIIIIALLYYVGFGKIAAVIMQMSIGFFIITLILDLTGLVFYALTWHILLKGLKCNVSFKTSLTVSLASIFTCYVTPSGVLLELLRVVLANKEAKVPIGYSAASVVMHRILYTVGFILCAAASFTVIQAKYTTLGTIGTLLLLIISLSIAFAAGILYLSHRADLIEKMLIKLYRRFEGRINKIIRVYESEEVVNSLSNTISDFKNAFLELRRKPLYLLTAFIAVLATWIVDVAIFYVVFLALNYPISIWAAALTIVIGDFVQMTPIMIPGMIGILETAFTTTLLAFGIPLDIAASASILARIATFWFDIPVTAIAASYYGIKYLLKGAEAIS